MAQSNTATLNLIDMVSRALKVLNRKTQSKDDKMYNPGISMTKTEYLKYNAGLQRIGHIVWNLDFVINPTTFVEHQDVSNMSDFFFNHDEEIWVLQSRADEIEKELLDILKKSHSPEICGFYVNPSAAVKKYQEVQLEKLIKKEKLYAEKTLA